MTPLDLGDPIEASGRCAHCHLDDRPIWSDGERQGCATCWARWAAGRDVRFGTLRGVVVARQPTLPL
jgi:hypothetical protein